MLKKFEMEAKSRDSQPVEEPSFQSIGFEPNETPIGSLKDPILIPPKLRIRFNHNLCKL